MKKLLLLAPCLALAACMTAADYGTVYPAANSKYNIESYGSTDKEASQKALKAAALACKEGGFNTTGEFTVLQRENAYTGSLGSEGVQRFASTALSVADVLTKKNTYSTTTSSQAKSNIDKDAFRSKLTIQCK